MTNLETVEKFTKRTVHERKDYGMQASFVAQGNNDRTMNTNLPSSSLIDDSKIYVTICIMIRNLFL